MFQINKINNGWLVAMPPSSMKQQQMISEGQQPQPEVNYCEGLLDVLECIQRNWHDGMEARSIVVKNILEQPDLL